jgi:hypothetical protein
MSRFAFAVEASGRFRSRRDFFAALAAAIRYGARS